MESVEGGFPPILIALWGQKARWNDEMKCLKAEHISTLMENAPNSY